MAIGKKLKVGAAAHIYKNRYGVFPKAVELDRVPDTGEDWRLPALDWYRKMKETT